MAERITSRFTRGFTLVELSIVLVIIGLLIAGITAGSSMVKQAEIRGVINEIQGFQVSYNNFKGTYGKIPGDMKTASSYWTASACADSGLADDCNGDGNRSINLNDGGTGGDEARPVWKHLSLAGMIDAGISKIPVTMVAFTPGVNAPASRLNGAGYMIVGFTLSSGATSNVLVLGKPDPNTLALTASALSAQDAFSIDQKLDDGILLSYAKPLGVVNSALAAMACDPLVETCDTGEPAACDPLVETCDTGGGEVCYDINGVEISCDYSGGGDTGGDGTVCEKGDPKCDPNAGGTGGGGVQGGSIEGVSGNMTGKVMYMQGSDGASCSFDNKSGGCILFRSMQ